jgi:hypothetical protein
VCILLLQHNFEATSGTAEVRVHNLMTRHDTSPFAEVRKWIGSGIHDMAYPTWRKAAIRTFKVTLGDFFRRTFETPRGTVRVSRTPGWMGGWSDKTSYSASRTVVYGPFEAGP